MLDDILKGLNIPDRIIRKYDLSSDEKLIEWPSGNKLLLQEIPQISYNRMYKITYSSKGRIIVLNELTQNNTDFYLTQGKHTYLLEGPSQTNHGHPEVLIPLDKIEKDESQILEVFHEIGHDLVKKELNKTKSRIDSGEPDYSYISIRMKKGVLDNDQDNKISLYSDKESPYINESFMKRWEERQAWYYALKLMRELDIQFEGLDKSSKILSRINVHLKTYKAEYSSRIKLAVFDD